MDVISRSLLHRRRNRDGRYQSTLMMSASCRSTWYLFLSIFCQPSTSEALQLCGIPRPQSACSCCHRNSFKNRLLEIDEQLIFLHCKQGPPWPGASVLSLRNPWFQYVLSRVPFGGAEGIGPSKLEGGKPSWPRLHVVRARGTASWSGRSSTNQGITMLFPENNAHIFL
jgi:hypothetical protein